MPNTIGSEVKDFSHGADIASMYEMQTVACNNKIVGLRGLMAEFFPFTFLYVYIGNTEHIKLMPENSCHST